MTTLAKLGFDIDTGNARGAKRDLDGLTGSANSAVKSAMKLAAAYVSVSGAMRAARAADSFGEMAERVRMATRNVDEFDAVQKRLTQTAQGTYRSLAEAQELYIRSADSLRSMGYTTGQLLDVTDSLSFAFVVNATSADRASSAIDAVTKSVQSGRVGADQWLTLMSAVPSIVDDIATASGRTSAEIRQLGVGGALAVEDLTEGLRLARDANQALSESMATTIDDAITRLGVSVTSLLGQLNEAHGVTGMFAGGIISASDAVDEFSTMLASGEIAHYVRAIGDEFEYLYQDVKSALDFIDAIVKDSAEYWGVTGEDGVGFLRDAFLGLQPNIKSAVQLATVELLVLVDRARVYGAAIGMALDPRNWGAGMSLADYIEQEQGRIDSIRDASIAEILRERDATIAASSERRSIVLAEGRALREEWDRQQRAASDLGASAAVSLTPLTRSSDEAAKAAERAAKAYASWVGSVRDAIDPLAAAERQIARVWEAFEAGDMQGISREQVKRYTDGLRKAASDGASEMERQFASASQRIASGLQDAIISGDWSGMGATIGGALAGSIADVTSTALAQQLGGQMGAILGPVGGAIAGGIVGALANELFSSGGYTGHTERQERTDKMLGGIDARAAEIASATQRSASALDQLVGMNRELLNAQKGIENASADLGFNVAQQLAELFTRGAVEVQDSRFGMIPQATKAAKDIGIIISGTLADATVESFLDFKGRIYRESNSVITSTFGDALASVTDLVRESATALGLSSDDIERAIGGIDLSRFGELSLGAGMGAEEQAEVVNALLATILSDAAIAAIPGLAAFVDRVGETVGSVMQQLATDTLAVTNSMSDLGISLGELTGLDLASVSEQLIAATGGIDAFQSGVQSFYRSFQSEQEQQRIQFERLTDEFGKFGMVLPSTSVELMRVAQTLDVTTESGREAFAMLIRTQSQLSSYYDTIERRTADLLASLTGGTDAAFMALQSSVSAERAALTQSYQAEQQAIQAATQARMDANRMALDAAKEGLQAISGEVNSLRGALDRLRGSFDPVTEIRRQSALNTLREALATGNLSGVGDAAGIAAQVDSAGFASREDFQFSQAKTIGLLASVDAMGGEQLDTAEKTIKRLEAQTNVIKAGSDAQLAALQQGFDDEMTRLDSIIANAESQLNALRGIDAGLLSIADALVELSKAMSAESGSGSIENIYRTLLGREADQEGLAYWKSSGLTGQALVEAMRYAAIVNGEVPRFANGGMHSGGLRMVGERGPEIEATGSARVMSNNDLMSALGGSRDTASELKGLREDLRAANRAIVKNAEQMRQIMQQWNQQGIPEERETV